jgi:hypothetical protein
MDSVFEAAALLIEFIVLLQFLLLALQTVQLLVVAAESEGDQRKLRRQG